jgi:hypothetical protein
LKTKKRMPMLPAALKGCDFLLTLAISSSDITTRESIAAGYEALGMSLRSVMGIGEKTGSSGLLLFQM